MSRKVVGLDLSLTCSGIAICVETRTGHRMLTETIKSKGKRAALIPDRHARITELGRDILHHAAVADLVVIEGPFAGTKGGSPIDRFALWWWVVGGLVRREVPVAVVSPTSLKLAIAGKGNCDKAALSASLVRLWPEVDVTSSDVADAAGLAHLGAVWLGWPVTTLERHRAVKAEWPLFPDPRAVA